MRARSLHAVAAFAATTGSLAVAYLALARLGFLVAIPPGNITALWPPSGLAVAALLVFGYRRASLGVWLGSFIVNGWAAADPGAAASLLIAAVIAFGSLVQTLAIAHVLRRSVGWARLAPGDALPAPARARQRDAAAFVALAALGCLIAATVGVTTIWAAGLLPAQSYAYAWGTWWLGDWAGILAVAPPLLALARWLWLRPSSARLTLAVVGVGLLLSAALFLLLRALETQRIAVEFAGDADMAIGAVRRSVEQSRQDLEVLNALYVASESVERDEFRIFVQPHLSGPGATPGIQALGWARYVPATDRLSFEAAARQAGFQSFQIAEQDARGQLVRAGGRSEYVAVEYIEPFGANQPVLGYDINSEPARNAALALARDSGRASATTPITLVSGAEPGVIRFWPIYRRGAAVGTVAERRASLQGFIYGAYRIHDLVDAGLVLPEFDSMDVYIFDRQAPADQQLLHLRSAPVRPERLPERAGVRLADLQAGLASAAAISIDAHIWVMVVKPAPAYESSRRTLLPWAALLIGLLLTGWAAIDLALRQQATDTLRHSEERFRALIEKSSSAVVLVSSGGTVTYRSPNYQKLLGVAPALSLGARALDMVAPEDAERARELFDQVLQEPGRSLSAELRVHYPDSSTRWVASTATNLLDDPAVGAIVTNLNDITARKQTERELQASEARYRLLIENSHDLIQSVDASGRFLLVNPAWLQTLEYAEADLPSLNLWDIIHPDSLQQCQAEFQALMVGANVGVLHPILISRSGRAVEVEGTAVPVLTDGQVLATNAFFRDVTARRQAERIQAAQFAANRTLADSPDLNVALAEVIEAIAVNLGWPQARLWCRDAIEDRMRWQQGWQAAEAPPAEPPAQTYRRGEGLVGAAWQANQAVEAAQSSAVWPAGALRPLVAFPIANRSDVWAVVEFLCAGPRALDHDLLAMLTDLGRQVGQFVARKQAEAALADERALLTRRVDERTADLSRANHELLRALRTKDSFLANMSHELRTPLNGILAMSEILSEQIRGPLNDPQLRSVQIIESSGRHLLSLINDILDLSKIEAGKLELQLDTLRIEDVCQASLSFVREMAIKKGLRLSYSCSDTTAYMQADARRLKQILVNLLSNAVKFTPKGGDVRLEAIADAERDLLRFVVEDTGIGIADADLGRLFKPFSQLDSSLSRAHEGTGLGLALVLRLTELHGGSVAAESAGVDGQGSRFTIAIPWVRAAEAAPAPIGVAIAAPIAAPAAGAPARAAVVLLAEDNEANILVTGDYIDHLGYRLVIARDGREAIERAIEVRPDVILMDVQMPQMDGLEATRQLRALPEFATTPIIALTALAMPGDRERCLQAGVSEYLSKPVSLRRLATLIEELLA